VVQDLVLKGICTKSEAKATKATEKCRIHVELANARLKDF